jgi:hypothetical protein
MANAAPRSATDDHAGRKKHLITKGYYSILNVTNNVTHHEIGRTLADKLRMAPSIKLYRSQIIF